MQLEEGESPSQHRVPPDAVRHRRRSTGIDQLPEGPGPLQKNGKCRSGLQAEPEGFR